MRLGLIYGYVNTTTGKWYVGQTINETTRKRGHKNACRRYLEAKVKGEGRDGACAKFYDAVSKYGWEGFEYVVLEKDIKQEDMNYREAHWIEFTQALDLGYNLLKYEKTSNKWRATSEVREKLSKALKNNPKNMGANHHAVKPPEFYETFPSTKESFRRKCRTHGWNFEDYVCTFAGRKYWREGEYYNLYTFKHK